MHRDCVSARCGDTAHRSDDRLARLAQCANFIGNYLGSECAATRTVNTQYNRGNRIVITGPSQQCCRRIGADIARRTFTEEDISGRDNDSNVFILYLAAADEIHMREVLVHADGVKRIRLIRIFPHQSDHAITHFCMSQQLVDKSLVSGRDGEVAVCGADVFDKVARKVVNCLRTEFTRCGDIRLV